MIECRVGAIPTARRVLALVGRSVATQGVARALPECQAQQSVIRAAKVYTLAGDPLQPGAVLVRDGKIVQVASSIEAPEGATVVDLGDGMLMPGLIDAQSSIEVVSGSAELTREVTPHFHVLRGIHWDALGFREALAEGITCVNVAPGGDNVLAGISSAVKTAGDRSHRVVGAETGLVMNVVSDPTARNRARSRPDSIYVRQPTNRMGVVWILRSTLQAAKSSVDAPVELAVAQTNDGPDASSVVPSSVPPKVSESSSVVARALSGKLRVFARSRTHYDMTSVLEIAGEFGFPVTVIGGHESYRLADLLAQHKVPVILDSLTTGSMVGPDDTKLFWNTPGRLHQASVEVALSGGQLLEQARFAVRFGLPAEAALQAVTVTPARLLGLQDRVGTIAPGRDADLVALAGEPLEAATAIRWVMINGTIYDEDN